MACFEMDPPQLLSTYQSCDGPFDYEVAESTSLELETSPSSCQFSSSKVPLPPPLPGFSAGPDKCSKRLKRLNSAPEETMEVWDRLFIEGYGADVQLLTEDKDTIMAHSCILGVASPVLREMLKQTKVKEGYRKIRMPGMPSEAVHGFIRFLYSSRYEPDVMKKFVLHLLVMSHTFSVPRLKNSCIELLECALLNADNVVDVLQLARKCDASRLSLICTRLIIKDFKAISASEGWKIMKQSNPSLEQELLESLVEEDSKKQDRMKQMEQRKVYVQLLEAMEALLHICRDGCRTIGPRDKMLKEGESACKFVACKGMESLVRHFHSCRTRVPGGCAQCKRMWQLLELHSKMCSEPDSCKVPLCRHFKDKMQNQSKKEELKWKLLVSKVMAAKGTISSISAKRELVA